MCSFVTTATLATLGFAWMRLTPLSAPGSRQLAGPWLCRTAPPAPGELAIDVGGHDGLVQHAGLQAHERRQRQRLRGAVPEDRLCAAGARARRLGRLCNPKQVLGFLRGP